MESNSASPEFQLSLTDHHRMAETFSQLLRIKLIITMENVYPLCRIANDFHIPELSSACKQFLIRKRISCKKLWNSFLHSNKLNLIQVHNFRVEEADKLFEKVLKNDILLMMNDEDLKNVLEKIEKIIKSNKRRVLTLEMIVNWAKIDFTTRKCFLPAVLKNLSLHKLQKEALVAKVCGENIIKESHPCSKFLCRTLYEIFSDKPPKKSKLRKIYCFGGEDRNNTLHSTVSHMDIDTGRWNESIIRMSPRKQFAGAVIGSKIYLCGGIDENNKLLKSTEVFDSATNTWMELAPMPEGRSSCAAAVLNGFIYVSGGKLGKNRKISQSVIRFDVQENKWECVKDMLERRYNHPLVQCNNRLYAIGSGEYDWFHNVENLSTKLIEFYDPITDKWEFIKTSISLKGILNLNYYPMINATIIHDNNIFIFSERKMRLMALYIEKETGNFLEDIQENKFQTHKEIKEYSFDYLHNFITLATIDDTIWTIGFRISNEDREKKIKGVYSYDFASDEWTRQSDMDIERIYYCSFAISNENTGSNIEKSFRSSSEHLYCFGGENESRQFIWSVSHMDVSTGEWDTSRAKCLPRVYFCGAVIGTKIYLCGGRTEDNTVLNTMEVFDCLTNTWIELCPMPEPRFSCAAAALNGYIYVTGGCESRTNGNSSHKMFRYNVKTNEWKKMKAMLNGRDSHQLVALNDRLYAIGGYQGDWICDDIEEYNPTTDKWTLACDLKVIFSENSAIVHDREIYMYYSYKFTVYSPDLNHVWRELTPIENSKTYEIMNLLPVNGQIWAVGGYNRESKLFIKSIFSYDPITDKWTQLQDIDIPRTRNNYCSFVVKA